MTSLVRSGGHAARFTLHPGDDPLDLDGERAELIRSSFETEGTESWWAWSSYFPADFVVEEGTNAWSMFMHWVSGADSDGCRPPLAFDVMPDGSESLRLLVRGGSPVIDADGCRNPTATDYVFGTLQREHWYDFLFHVVWSADPAIGRVDLWVDCSQAIKNQRVATLYAGDPVTIKLGFYRSDSTATSSVTHDELRRGNGAPGGL